MNILHLKYALEVARAGSISKAAEALYMNPPNLSRAIRDLESSLGITIFDRTAKGIYVTPEGEEFLGYAKKILRQIDEVEQFYKTGITPPQRFSISVPRASYISAAFTAFSRSLTAERAEVYYKETNAMRTLQNVIGGEYKLGILRYAVSFDKHFKEMLEEKGLAYELVTEFHYALLMSERHPLAGAETISRADLAGYIELAHADPFVPSVPLAVVKKEEQTGDAARRIFLFERGSQFELLSGNPETYMWVSPMPKEILERWGLVQRDCPENRKQYKDILIYRRDYKLTPLDQAFITELCRSKRGCMQT